MRRPLRTCDGHKSAQVVFGVQQPDARQPQYPSPPRFCRSIAAVTVQRFAAVRYDCSPVCHARVATCVLDADFGRRELREDAKRQSERVGVCQPCTAAENKHSCPGENRKSDGQPCELRRNGSTFPDQLQPTEDQEQTGCRPNSETLWPINFRPPRRRWF